MSVSEYVFTVNELLELREILDLPNGSTAADAVARVRILKEERDDRQKRWEASNAELHRVRSLLSSSERSLESVMAEAADHGSRISRLEAILDARPK